MEYYVKSYASHASSATEGTGLGYTEESQSLKIYFEELSFHCDGRLSRHEEAALAERIRQGDMQARDHLVRANLPFVVTVAKRYQRRGLGLDDLIGAGNMGLITAAERFDGGKGIKFISYAVWWIRQAIMQAIAEQGPAVRLPVNKRNLLKEISETARRLGQGRGDEPNWGEVAQAVGRTEREVVETVRATRVPHSLDREFNGDDQRSLSHLLADREQVLPDTEALRRLTDEKVQAVLDGLSRREASVLRLYYGLGHDRIHTLQEIGRSLNLTRERVRQIRDHAFAKLRHPRYLQLLRGLILED